MGARDADFAFDTGAVVGWLRRQSRDDARLALRRVRVLAFCNVSVREQIVARLGAEPTVQFALLFGSRVAGGARLDSDWDVAVYLGDDLTREDRFRTRVRLAAELAETAPTDVVVLNDADPLLGQRALAGELIIARDRRSYVRYFVRSMGLAEDQRYFDRILAKARARRLAEGTFGRP